MSELRYRHPFPQGKETMIWTSTTPHAYGLVRVLSAGNNEIDGEGLIKAFTLEEREAAIDFAKAQREEPIHDGYKLKLVKLTPEEFTPVFTGSRVTGSHSSCDHPATSAARRECRAKRRAGIL